MIAFVCCGRYALFCLPMVNARAGESIRRDGGDAVFLQSFTKKWRKTNFTECNIPNFC